MRVVDANVILRYLLSDHAEHHRLAAAFWERVKAGDETAWMAERSEERRVGKECRL